MIPPYVNPSLHPDVRILVRMGVWQASDSSGWSTALRQLPAYSHGLPAAMPLIY